MISAMINRTRFSRINGMESRGCETPFLSRPRLAMPVFFACKSKHPAGFELFY